MSEESYRSPRISRNLTKLKAYLRKSAGSFRRGADLVGTSHAIFFGEQLVVNGTESVGLAENVKFRADATYDVLCANAPAVRLCQQEDDVGPASSRKEPGCPCNGYAFGLFLRGERSSS